MQCGAVVLENIEKVLNFKIGFQDLKKYIYIQFGQNVYALGTVKVWKF